MNRNRFIPQQFLIPQGETVVRKYMAMEYNPANSTPTVGCLRNYNPLKVLPFHRKMANSTAFQIENPSGSDIWFGTLPPRHNRHNQQTKLKIEATWKKTLVTRFNIAIPAR